VNAGISDLPVTPAATIPARY